MIVPHTLELALLSAAVLGFRHGFDYDHVAAISDITSVESIPQRAMRMGLVYALGHAATIALLGGAVILFQRSLPARVDSWAEHAVGGTLVLLGIYVLGTLLRNNASYTPKSRASILISACRWLSWQITRIFNPTMANTPRPAEESYSPKSIFLIGVIHGLGAETPSQLLLFLLAANLGGLARGFLGLGMFLVGLFAMNTLMTASAIRLFGVSATKPQFRRLVIGLTAAYSLIVGAIFLFGFSPLLPPLG
jgi:high-affinity nickel permease